ncbi:Cytochrome P450 [Amanita muscaria]
MLQDTLSALPLSTFAIPSIVILLSSAFLLRAKRQDPPYPPGPPSKFLIGNALDIPFKKPWLRYWEMSKQLNSDTIHLGALNTHFVVLHKMEDAVALMEQGSYSSRPFIPIAEISGLEHITALLPYGNMWRKHRKIFQEVLKKDVIPSYHNVQTQKMHIFLGELLHDPEEFAEHCETLAIAVSMAMTFAYDVIPGKTNSFVELSQTAGKTLAKLALPGYTMINVVPVLRHIPPWFPFASTQKIAADLKKTAKVYWSEPFDYVRKSMAAGTSNECLVTNVLQRYGKNDGSLDDEETVKEAIGTIYLAGVETLECAQKIFILAMALNTQVQKKAQEELDHFVGNDRFPTFEDRPSMPYIEAVYREVLRWRPVFPVGLVHSTVSDDVYKGMYIPKGAFVMPNVWAMTRDESVYPDPGAFNPERFFKDDGTLNDDTVDYAFGFGRRVCPGRHMADAMIWLMIATVLSVFNISKAKDENGNEIDIDVGAFTDAFISHPMPFKCSIVPRSQEAEASIRNAAKSAQQSLKMS